MLYPVHVINIVQYIAMYCEGIHVSINLVITFPIGLHIIHKQISN